MELDDFEFRPITDGLGFDKTTEEGVKTSIPAPKKAKSELDLNKTEFEMQIM